MFSLPRFCTSLFGRTPSRPAARRLVALDADGVLLDHQEAYARAWKRAFGNRPALKDPLGHGPAEFWNVPRLEEKGFRQLRDWGFTEEAWRTMPALPGAVQACALLRDAGYSLVCVTALEPRFAAARAENLEALGIRLDDLVATGSSPRAGGNPKAAALHRLQPALFVDDHLPYLQGLPRGTWRALVEQRPRGSPNADPGLAPPDSRHISVLDAARCWLARQQEPQQRTGSARAVGSGP